MKFLEHKQRCRLGERLVLTRDLTLQRLDALPLGRTPRRRRLGECFVERPAPRIELLAVNTAPPQKLAEFLVQNRLV